MRYSVYYSQAAEQELAAIWIASFDQEAITEDAWWLDEQLATNPLQFGESRTSSIHRVAFHQRLGIEFEVLEDDKRVIVHAVFSNS